MNHKSLCPRSYIQDNNNLGRFNFIHHRGSRPTLEPEECTSEQLEDCPLSTPGPGEYEVMANPNRVKLGVIMAQHKNCQSISQAFPGPGRYNCTITQTASNFKSTPSIIFSPPRVSRFKEEIKEETPGPGQYKCDKAKRILSNFNSSCVYSISKTRRNFENNRSATPGPASYEAAQYGRQSKRPESRFKFVHGFPS